MPRKIVLVRTGAVDPDDRRMLLGFIQVLVDHQRRRDRLAILQARIVHRNRRGQIGWIEALGERVA